MPDKLAEHIRTIPDFPKPGIQFRDITTLLAHPEAFRHCMHLLERRYHCECVDAIAGVDARGFIFGSVLADRLGLGFIPIRKAGKLPAPTVSESYELEYGENTLEMHKDAVRPGQKIVLVDDLLATGGTARASINLIHQLDAIVHEACFILEISALNGRDKLNPTPVFSLLPD